MVYGWTSCQTSVETPSLSMSAGPEEQLSQTGSNRMIKASPWLVVHIGRRDMETIPSVLWYCASLSIVVLYIMLFI